MVLKRFLIGFDISDIYVFQKKKVCQNQTMENHINLHIYGRVDIRLKEPNRRSSKYHDIAINTL